jgi:hypothetical protein
LLTDYHMTLNRAGIPVWRPAQPATGREDEHQTALTQWARMMRTQYPALTLYHHIPNGGLRDKRTAARLIGQGGTFRRTRCIYPRRPGRLPWHIRGAQNWRQ